jgi:hypothetical protein
VINNPLNYTDPSGYDFWSDAADWVSKPWNAFALQQIPGLRELGTYLLIDSEQGRNILAGEIIIGTAALTYGCLGVCSAGVTSGLIGADIGETTGAYKANRKGEEILPAVIKGGVEGYISGYIGGTIADGLSEYLPNWGSFQPFTYFGSDYTFYVSKQIVSSTISYGVQKVLDSTQNGFDTKADKMKSAPNDIYNYSTSESFLSFGANHQGYLNPFIDALFSEESYLFHLRNKGLGKAALFQSLSVNIAPETGTLHNRHINK